jgi:hypothetical protein
MENGCFRVIFDKLFCDLGKASVKAREDDALAAYTTQT